MCETEHGRSGEGGVDSSGVTSTLDAVVQLAASACPFREVAEGLKKDFRVAWPELV